MLTYSLQLTMSKWLSGVTRAGKQFRATRVYFSLLYKNGALNGAVICVCRCSQRINRSPSMSVGKSLELMKNNGIFCIFVGCY